MNRVVANEEMTSGKTVAQNIMDKRGKTQRKLSGSI